MPVHAHIAVDNGLQQVLVSVPGTDPIEPTTINNNHESVAGQIGDKGICQAWVTDDNYVVLNDAEVELEITPAVGVSGVIVTPPTTDAYKVLLVLIG
jgi:hypothetical protein